MGTWWLAQATLACSGRGSRVGLPLAGEVPTVSGFLEIMPLCFENSNLSFPFSEFDTRLSTGCMMSGLQWSWGEGHLKF